MADTKQQLTQEALYNQAKEAMGFVPNVIKEMVDGSPVAAKIYLDGDTLLEHATLNAKELEVAKLTISARRECDYCSRAHTLGARQAGVSDEELTRIRKGQRPHDERLGAIFEASNLLLERGGWLKEDDLGALKKKGIGKAELYDLVAVAALKTLTNYVNHIAHTEVDGPLQKAY